MSAYQSLDELVAAGHSQSPSDPGTDTAPPSSAPTPTPTPTPTSAPAEPAARSRRAARRTTKTVKKTTRFTDFPGIRSLVNQNDPAGALSEPAADADGASQVAVATLVMTRSEDACDAAAEASQDGAGKQESPNPVNHAQVMVPEEFPDEIRRQLAHIGVNLRASQLGRKHVFDEFLRGRLVSLLAMGLTLRQSASALGVSHAAIWKELRKNAELSEQVNAARFQAQIEPLLVILRASKQNWRAATWLINYLTKSLGKREMAGDEIGRYDKEAATEQARQHAELRAIEQIEELKAKRKVREESRKDWQ